MIQGDAALLMQRGEGTKLLLKDLYARSDTTIGGVPAQQQDQGNAAQESGVDLF